LGYTKFSQIILNTVLAYLTILYTHILNWSIIHYVHHSVKYINMKLHWQILL
jgi:hypothetical protein